MGYDNGKYPVKDFGPENDKWNSRVMIRLNYLDQIKELQKQIKKIEDELDSMGA